MAVQLEDFRSVMITRVSTVVALHQKKRELDAKLQDNQMQVVEELKTIIGKDSLLKKAERSDEISLRMFAGRMKDTFAYITTHISDIEQKVMNELSSSGIDIYSVITKIRKFAKVGETLVGQLSDILIEEANTLKANDTSSYLDADLPLEEKYMEQVVSFASTLYEEIQPVLIPVSEYIVKLQYDTTGTGVDAINIMVNCAVFSAFISTYAQNTDIFEKSMRILGSPEIRDYLDKKSGGSCKQITNLVKVAL